MIVLQETNSTQTIYCIARQDECTHLILTDEEQGTTTQINCSFYSYGYYNALDVVLSLREGKHYIIDIYNDTTLIYKDKIYCTNQTIDAFSINNGQYTSKDSNNDYITL